MEKAFSKEEIAGISQIMEFMDSLVLANNKSLNLEKAYHRFFDSIARNILDPGVGQAALEEEYKFSFFQRLDSTVFQAFWEDLPPRFVRINGKTITIDNPSNFHSIDANTRGNLMKYFKLLSRKDKIFNEIYETIKESGSVTTPTIFGGMFYNHESLDYSKVDLRFWAAIFYLSVEESIDKKLERYYK